MAEDRPDAERASAFASVAARLDRALADARPGLEAAGVTIEDKCERGVYSPHYYPGYYFRWRHHLARQGSVGGCTVRVGVTLEYEEPFDTAPPPSVQLLVLAEVFLMGQESFITWRDERAYPLAELEREGVERLTTGALEAGTAAIPLPYRSAVARE